MTYRPDIDGMRALAVLSVMLYHLQRALLPGGFVGVDIFFVISGFVVSGSLAASPSTSIRHFVTSFYDRRLARIIPALVVVLVSTALLSSLLVPKAWLSKFSEETGLSAFLGLSNWVMQTNSETYFAPRAEFNPFTHTWSLGVEEQFYLCFPLLFYFWARARKDASDRASWILAMVALLAAASLAGCIWASAAQPNAAFYSIAFRFWELAAGALLFQVTSWQRSLGSERKAWPSAVATWIGAALVVYALLRATSKGFPFPWALSAVLGSLLLLGGVHPRDAGIVRRILSSSIPVWIGRRSYSLYLWHWPIYVLLRWTSGVQGLISQTAAVGLTFLLASASYRWVERPLRQNARLQRYPVALQISFFLVLIGCGWLLAKAAFDHRAQISLSVVSRNSSDWYPDQGMPYSREPRCDVAKEFRHIPPVGAVVHFVPVRCQIRPPNQKLTVFGDSQAGAFMPIYETLASETGIDVTLYTGPGCAYLDLIAPMNVGKPLGCAEMWGIASQEVLQAANTGDVLFLSSLRLRRFCDQWECHADAEVEAQARSDQAMAQVAKASNEAVDWLRPFSAKGLQILFEAPKPIFKSPPFRCSDWFNSANPVCRGGSRQPRAYLEALRSPIVSAISEISAQIPDVKIWDPLPVLCPTETCSAFRDGRPLYLDADHISAFGNSVLYPSFKHAIGAVPGHP